jgi:SprT protein
MAQTQEHFRRLVHECIERAEHIYNVDFGRVTITFDLRGENAAWSIQKPHPTLGVVYKLRFNREALRMDWDFMVNSAIPHEVAHLVAFADPSLGVEANHDAQWREIAIALGDSQMGRTTHTLPLRPARRLTKFIYRNDQGALASISSRLHRRLQAGECYAFKVANDIFAPHHFDAVTVG